MVGEAGRQSISCFCVFTIQNRFLYSYWVIHHSIYIKIYCFLCCGVFTCSLNKFYDQKGNVFIYNCREATVPNKWLKNLPRCFSYLPQEDNIVFKVVLCWNKYLSPNQHSQHCMKKSVWCLDFGEASIHFTIHNIIPLPYWVTCHCLQLLNVLFLVLWWLYLWLVHEDGELGDLSSSPFHGSCKFFGYRWVA